MSHHSAVLNSISFPFKPSHLITYHIINQQSHSILSVISFCFPLTIIVGANGCGKTTIIEALRYAVTGALPPGNKSGQAFVHDPKSVGSSSVKAQVKLKFNNRAGKSMVVVRSMELIQKKTSMQFKNLDGVLRTTDDQGNKQSLSLYRTRSTNTAIGRSVQGRTRQCRILSPGGQFLAAPRCRPAQKALR